MQTTTPTFRQHAQGYIRPLTWGLKASFDKTLDPAVEFFTLDSSVLDGDDKLAPVDSDVIQEWDKYVYADYDDRVIELEWQREENVPFSVNLAIADVKLNNFDNYFTKGAGSPIDANLLPRRPIKILSGFGIQALPQFVGLTSKAPDVDQVTRIATIHAEDFLSFIFERSLKDTVILQSKFTHEVLDVLFQAAGLVPDQYELDTSFNLIDFVFFEKDSKVGDAIRKLMQAELGSLFMDELGKIRFRNRQRVSAPPVMTFNESNIISLDFSDEGEIINVVEITANVRKVQQTQTIYSLGGAVELKSGVTELFFNFEDPVTSVEDIVQYTANILADGTGSDITASVDITATVLFATSVKVTFDNSADSGFLTALTIYGTPAKITKELFLRSQDDDSVEKFEEQVLPINNDFIQSDSLASSIALSILNYYKDYANTVILEVKGTPALQLGDTFTIDYKNINQDFVLTKSQNTLAGSKFTQILTGKVFNIPDYFTLDESLLDGNEALA